MKELTEKQKNKIVLLILMLIISIILIGTVINFINKNKVKNVSNNELGKVENTDNEHEISIANVNETEKTIDLTEKELKKSTEEEIKKQIKKEDKNNKMEEKKDQNSKDNNKKANDKNLNKYYIKVNYGAQLVDVYTHDNEGKYNKIVKTFICSTGDATPKSGTYKIPNRWEWLFLFGDVYGHYVTQISGHILFHSVPYIEKGNLGSLKYWEYDKLGTKASLGCIRLTARDAKWIYDNVSSGSIVEFYSDSSQISRRPTAKKISNAPSELRGWDPTDPNLNNPWRTYTQKPTPSIKPKPTVEPTIEPSIKPTIKPEETIKPESTKKPTVTPSVKPNDELEEKNKIENKIEDKIENKEENKL